MKNRFFQLCLIWVSQTCFADCLYSQSEELEKQVITTELNGRLVRAVPDEISIEYALQRMATASELRSREGEMAALTEIHAEHLKKVQSRLEITDDQIEQLHRIRKQFASEVAELDIPDVARVNKLKLKYCMEIGTVFFPSQLKAFANITDTRVLILTRLIDDENVAGVDLTPEQKQEIRRASEEIREPLEKVLKRHQDELQEYREKLKAICERVLTEDQQEKVRKNWIEPDRFIDYMSLNNILDDVILVIK